MCYTHTSLQINTCVVLLFEFFFHSIYIFVPSTSEIWGILLWIECAFVFGERLRDSSFFSTKNFIEIGLMELNVI